MECLSLNMAGQEVELAQIWTGKPIKFLNGSLAEGMHVVCIHILLLHTCCSNRPDPQALCMGVCIAIVSSHS